MNKWWLLLIILCLCGTAVAILGILQGKNHNGPSQSSQAGRIVSLAPNLTEILFALGLGERIAAVSNDSDYPAGAAEKKMIGTFWQPNTEAIIASRPDLVVTLSFEQQKSAADTLNRLGYKVLTLKIEKIEELLAAIVKIGAATGHQPQAAQLVKNTRDRINDLQSKLNSTNKVKVLWVVQVEPLRIAAPNTFINQIIELAGGKNAIGPTIGQYPQISTEELLRCSPEVIIQSAMGSSNISAQQHAAQAFWSKWPNLPAVKNKRIYVVDSDTTLRLGPRLPEAIELIAHCLHPDAFTQNRQETKQTR